MCVQQRPDGPAVFLWRHDDGTFECAVCHRPIEIEFDLVI